MTGLDAPTQDAKSPLPENWLGSKRDLMSVYFWTDEEKKEFLTSCGVSPAGRESPPKECDICGQSTPFSYDVHVILQHPETRPRPVRPAEPEKKKRRKK
jgi:hypothetical protein